MFDPTYKVMVLDVKVTDLLKLLESDKKKEEKDFQKRLASWKKEVEKALRDNSEQRVEFPLRPLRYESDRISFTIEMLGLHQEPMVKLTQDEYRNIRGTIGRGTPHGIRYVAQPKMSEYVTTEDLETDSDLEEIRKSMASEIQRELTRT